MSTVALTSCTTGKSGFRSREDGSASLPAAAPYLDPAVPVGDRVADLLGRMSLEDKAGQMVQAGQGHVRPAQMTASRLGSVSSGPGSAPRPNTPAAWADRYGTYQRAAMSTPLGIPMIYGIEALPGSGDVFGATVFPGHLGLGATHDPALVRKVGRAAAEEITGAGPDWTFGPSLRVARDDRRARPSESFGGTPAVVGSMTTLIEGLQGPALNAAGSVLAGAADYPGDEDLSEEALRATDLPPFQEAVRRGAGSVLVSADDWRSERPARLITGILKGELRFAGFVAAEAGSRRPAAEADVAAAVNAGVDMLMAGRGWAAVLESLRSAAETHRVPLARIDDANRRILTKKFELGLFERPYPDRSFAGTIGSSAHRDLARQAVRESQVLLKNTGRVLPVTGDRVFVAGSRADDTAGEGATSILQGIRHSAGSGTVVYQPMGYGADATYDAAVAVVGAQPGSTRLDVRDRKALAHLRTVPIPLVVVLVSGEPLDIAADLDDWDAAVAAWLPGSEGGGVADVLFGDYHPTGKLPVSWPGEPRLPQGFGLDYRN